jgi:protein SCO1
MTKKHTKHVRKQNSMKLVGLLFLLSGIFISCEQPNDLAKQGLPYIGHYDIAFEEADGYSIGDTIYHQVPEFLYLTQDSTELSSEDIKGKVWVAKFFFSTCPTICPPMTSSMKQLRADMAEYDADLVYLSFSINPKKDTPSRLQEYIAEHEIENTENWYFLTGVEEDETHILGTEGFKIHAMSDDNAPGGYAHSPNFILVDQNLHIRGLYDGLEPNDVNQLKEDIKKLLKK